MQRHELYPSQLVMHTGLLSRVEKINPKWIVVIHEDGQRWNAYAHNLTLAPADAVFNLEEASGLTLGTVVQFKDGQVPGLFVVVHVGRADFRVSRLGGDHGRYYHNVPAASLEVVPVSEIATVLA